MNILSQIKLTREEVIFLKRETDIFLKELNHKLKKINARAIIGGSFAKNTLLKDTKEIDIFVKFAYPKYKNKSNQLSNVLAKYLTHATKIHGSRDYFQIMRKGITFEIVPVLDIKNPQQALNVTDVSPLHASYIKKHLSSKKADEVRLLKQFCKANNIYGAESYIQGFSGYVLEILILHYKTFNNVLKQAMRWKEKIIIDTIHKYKNERELLLKLNIAKVYSPLILIDPVQPNRNIAAALSQEKFEQFKRLAKDYLKNPGDHFFKEEKFLPVAKKDQIILKVIPREGKRDVVGSQIVKAFTFLKQELEREGFLMKNSQWYWEKECYFIFQPKAKQLPKLKKHYGPPIEKKESVEKFQKKWKSYSLKKEKGKVFVYIPRKITGIEEYFSFLFKQPYLKIKVESIKIIKK